MNSSSSDHENQDVKQEPHEGPYALDPNDEFDLRNGVLKSDISDCLPSSSGSDRTMHELNARSSLRKMYRTSKRRPTVGHAPMMSCTRWKRKESKAQDQLL
jgi:hypothetical protein